MSKVLETFVVTDVVSVGDGVSVPSALPSFVDGVFDISVLHFIRPELLRPGRLSYVAKPLERWIAEYSNPVVRVPW